MAPGGSTIVLATLTPAPRRMVGFDPFGMVPPPGERDATDAFLRATPDAEIVGGRGHLVLRRKAPSPALAEAPETA